MVVTLFVISEMTAVVVVVVLVIRQFGGTNLWGKQ